MWKAVSDRESGIATPHSSLRRIRRRRLSSLRLSNRKQLLSPHRSSVTSLHVDLTEGRYLLSAASDGSVAVCDVQRASEFLGGGLVSQHRSIFVVDKQHERGHKYAVSSAIWYPVDTGLFVTGSYDHCINVWDTNTVQVVTNFMMPGKVYATAMSSIATDHMLIAAGTEDVQVRLCDIASGAFTHTLSGHRDGIMSIQWSTSIEWVLMSGGCDGAIRFWDIRRAGCFLVLDQSHSQLGTRPPLLEKNLTKVLKRNSGSGMRHLLSGQKNQNLRKGELLERQHPGMMSSHNRATAHYGSVTGLKVTGDGLYLISAGSDSRIRLWDIESGRNTLVNYDSMKLPTSKPIQLAITDDSSLIFVPCMTSVKAFELWSGRTSMPLYGHYECVNCCWYSHQDQELYSGSNDTQILVWSPSDYFADEEDAGRKRGTHLCDEDYWSS